MIVCRRGRAVICCDLGSCVARMDLAPWAAYVARGTRLPTGWQAIGENRHACPLHDSVTSTIYRRQP